MPKPAVKKPARTPAKPAKKAPIAQKSSKNEAPKSIEAAPREPAPVLSELGSSLPDGPYVYALAHQGQPFYIGKGRGRRMFQHVLDALRGARGRKCEKIRAIFAAGGEIEYQVLGRYGSDTEAYAAEKQLIARGGDLTNIVGRNAKPISPRERAQQSFASLLAVMKPYDQWEPSLPPHLRTVAINVFGSPAGLYNTLKAVAEKGAANPPPNFFFVNPDRTVRASWV